MQDDAFAQGILAMRQSLYRVSYGLLREEQDRYDAVQEALAKAWEKRHTLRNIEYLRTWVTRILINECHNIQRRQQRVAPVDALDACPAPPVADATVHDALLALPQALRLITVLHYMEGYSIKEIARMLHIPAGTVGTRLHRARAQLRRMLDDALEEDQDA